MVHKRNCRWALLKDHTSLHPTKGWSTPNLTIDQLRRAYLQDTDFNPCAFPDHDGKPIRDFGRLFKECTRHWTSTQLTYTRFRKYLQTSTHSKIINIGLDHTQEVGAKHYEVVDMKNVMKEWNEFYSLTTTPPTTTTTTPTATTTTTRNTQIDVGHFISTVHAFTINQRVNWKALVAEEPYNAFNQEYLREFNRRLVKKRKRTQL